MLALYATEDLEPVDDDDYRHKLLWAAVMRLAIVDWVGAQDEASLRKRRVWQNAQRWLFEDERELWCNDEGVSFVALCRVIGVEPSFIRAQAKKMTKLQVRTAKLTRDD